MYGQKLSEWPRRKEWLQKEKEARDKGKSSKAKRKTEGRGLEEGGFMAIKYAIRALIRIP